MKASIFIGHDRREEDALAVARTSIFDNLRRNIPIFTIELEQMRRLHLYHRSHEGPPARSLGDPDFHMWDDISNAPMSTDFAISRFLTPILARRGWALFVDCDVMARADLTELFEHANDDYAVMCVKHDAEPQGRDIKMDGQQQTSYPRKNWSSVMLFNCDHPANQKLDLRMINTLPGRELHAFGWLEDDQIGRLPKAWNHLVGVNDPNPDAKLVHFTLGVPRMRGCEDCEFADEWWDWIRRQAALDVEFSY